MAEPFTEVDHLLLRRWHDSVAIYEAINELEKRMGARFEAGAESLRSWLDERGFSFFEVEEKYARLNVARTSWLNKKKQPYVWFMIDAVLPYGYRWVTEDQACVWVDCRNLEKDDRQPFGEHLASRIKDKPGGWLNEHCSRDYPAGRFLAGSGDTERLVLAQDHDKIAHFMREALSPILALADDVEAAMRATTGK